MKHTVSDDFGKSLSGEEEDKPNLRQLVEVLTYITKSHDPNGVDLRFMNAREKRENCKSTEKIVSALTSSRFRGITNMDHCLNQLLQEYTDRIDNWRNSKSDPKRWFLPYQRPREITFYLFTNGVWQGGENFGQAAIGRLVNKLESVNLGRSQVGIQFIDFSTEPEGRRRLQELDLLNRTHALRL